VIEINKGALESNRTKRSYRAGAEKKGRDTPKPAQQGPKIHAHGNTQKNAIQQVRTYQPRTSCSYCKVMLQHASVKKRTEHKTSRLRARWAGGAYPTGQRAPRSQSNASRTRANGERQLEYSYSKKKQNETGRSWKNNGENNKGGRH